MVVRPLAALAAGLLLAVSACSGGDDEPRADDTTSAPTSASTSDDSSDPDLPEGFGDGPPGQGLKRFYDQELSWEDCGTGDECASVWVPLDYADPDGQAITVQARLQPAADQANRVGTLFINPGGPGGSGIDYLGYAAFSDDVTNAYDILGFDPRGVATSTPIDCLSDEETDAFVATDPSPDTPQEVKDFEGVWSDYVAGCQERSGPLLAHVSTVEVARDMDIMRELVGDSQLNYFGASYGTYIGATYAGLFPDKVGRMVLDGAVDPEADVTKSQFKQVLGFETALTAYLQDCVGQGDCPLGDTVDQSRQKLVSLLADLDQQPLETSSGRELTEGLAFLGVVLPLYSRDSWPVETQALDAALQGNGDVLLQLADLYASRTSDGTYTSNSIEVQSPVNCLDHPQQVSLQQIEADAPRIIARAPVFGPAGVWFPYGCSNWPVSASEPPPDFSAKGAAPIVVIGTTRDPATPYQQAVRLAAELDSGVLLSRDGDGHTAYGQGNACIDSAVDAYLVDGNVPADGTTC